MVGVAAGLSLMATLAAAQTQTGNSQAGVIPVIPKGDRLGGRAHRTARRHGPRHETTGARSEARRRGSAQDRIIDGRYFWASREKQPLTATTSGEFMYLTSTEPGKFVRFKKLNDRIPMSSMWTWSLAASPIGAN